MVVNGCAPDMQSTALTWGGNSQAAGNQANNAILAAEQMPPSVCVGQWADQVRSYEAEIHAGFSAVQEAYDRVASMLTRVAHAVDEAQRDEKAMHTAKQAMDTAKQNWQLAVDQLDVVARMVPADPAEVAIWGQRVTQLWPPVEHTTRAYQSAQHRFQEADQLRTRMLQSFALLCEEEALIAERAIPQAPAGSFIDIAAVNQLHTDAAALLDLPLLAVSGFAVSMYGQVEQALRTVNPAPLNAYAQTVINQATIKPHPNGGDISFLDVVEFPFKELYQFGAGAVDGTAAALQGVYQLVKLVGANSLLPAQLFLPGVFGSANSTLAEDKAIVSGFFHPGRLVSAFFNWHLLAENPAKWAGALVPAIALAAVTDGVGAASTRATNEAVDASLGSIGSAEASKLADAIKALENPATKLDWAKLGVAVAPGQAGLAEVKAADLLFQQKTLLDRSSIVVGRGGLAGTLDSIATGQNEDPGLLPGKGAEKSGALLGKTIAGE